MGNEEWLPVPDWGNYEVSNTGKVRNVKFNRELKQFSDGNYLQTSFSQDGKRDVRRVHLIVAAVFERNPNNLPFINHEDGNKLNNNDWNLKGCTAKENSEHSVRMGLRKPKRTFKIKNPLLIKVKELVVF